MKIKNGDSEIVLNLDHVVYVSTIPGLKWGSEIYLTNGNSITVSIEEGEMIASILSLKAKPQWSVADKNL